MEINWFTVIAQIVNFLILVWLLKRFLYKPVLNAIDQREKKIADQLQEAAAKKADAEKEHDLFLQKNIHFDNERAAKMDGLQEEVDSEKSRLLEEVRDESNALRTKYDESLKQQERDMQDTIKRKTQDAVFSIAGKTLADIADANLEEQAIQVFIKKIEHLDAANKEELKNALRHADKKVAIKSAFEISDSSKMQLEKCIEEITGDKNSFKYELEPELISGIEIDTKTYQVSWNIESYLDSLNTGIITKEKQNEAG